jgi:histidinol phosphatase-like enzyme
MIKAFLSDLDTTLVYGWTAPDREWEPMPGVLEVLGTLRKRSVPVEVLTNQAGIFYQYFQGEIMKLNPTWKRKDYPSTSQLSQRLGSSMKALGLTDIYVAIWDERIRRLLLPSGEEVMGDIMSHRPYTPIEVHAERLAKELQWNLSEQGLNAQVSEHPNWRKPNPGMILKACADLGIEDLSTVVYCGDMHSEKQNSDRLAAQNAGVRFLEAERIRDILEML